MDKKTLSIHPLDLGTLVKIDKSIFTVARNQGEKIDVPCIGWLILGGEKKVLVDTGPSDPEWASLHHRPLAKSSSQEIKNALNKYGLRPDDIEVVIFTHLHWDHCFNLEHFPKATFWVQKTELQYAVAPLPTAYRTYEAGVPGVQPPWMKVFGSLKLADGDQEILPGIRVLYLPGHSPGSQGVVVDTGAGQWLIAGDNVPLYENCDGDGSQDIIPSGIYENLHSYYDSLKIIIKYHNRILPGHEEKIFNCSEYPNR